MGLFSSKTVYAADVTTQLAIPEKKHKAFAQDVILGKVFGNDKRKSLAQGISESIQNGLQSKVRQFYNYGKEQYKYGLPVGTLTEGDVNTSAIKTTIENLRGVSIEMEEVFVDLIEAEFLAWELLDIDFGFNIETAVISRPVESGQTGDQLFIDAELLDDDTIEITYEYNGVVKDIIYPVSELDRNQLYITALYREVGTSSNRLRAWNYRVASELHPIIQLETLFTDTEYLPVCAVRYDFESIDESHPDYDQTRKMLGILGIDPLDIISGIESDGSDADDPSGDENVPEQIRDVFAMFKADIQSDDPYVKKYLFEYFKRQYAFQSFKTRALMKAFIDSGADTGPKPQIIDITNEVIKSKIGFNFIDLETKTGNFGRVGDIRTTTQIEDSAGITLPFMGKVFDTEMSSIRYDKQISETEYESVLIHGLYHLHDVHNKATVTRTLADSVDDPDDSGFYIPVSQSVVNDMGNAFDRMQVYQSTLAIVVYSLDRQKVKWYEQGWFGDVIKIAAIAWTIFSLGSDGGAALSVAFALEVVANVIVHLIITAAVEFAITSIIDIFGLEAAALLAVISTAIAIYQGGLTGPDGMPWAEDLLKISQMSFSGINNYIAEESASLRQEYEDFVLLIEEKYDELNEVNEMLQGGEYSLLDTIRRVQKINTWESPQQYYYRTIHIGNPGVAVLDTAEQFIPNQLKLPKDIKPV